MKNIARVNAQSGVALMVVLILLLIVTVLGLASMRGTLLQERMAGASYARSVAFNAAEVALLQGESVAANKPVVPGAGCVSGVCAIPKPGDRPVWEASGFWNGSGPQTVALDAGKYHGASAKYIVQYMGESGTLDSTPLDLGTAAPPRPAGKVYMVVAQASLPNNTEVVLQSIYKAL
ncbi:hypothetical protein CO612_02530 [Lysobacteraceae bacterium NML71-0210]|nr:hypothetical protein CO612_02530 [Xanthomonadaceae bacterium NML71-0210]